MRLDTILTPARTLCRAPASSKKRVLENIAQFICQDLTGFDPNVLFANLVARERLGSTGLGQGIAIPHCRLKDLDRVVGSLITLEQPIDFEAIDDKPVDILFVLIVPEQATQEHLNTLAALAELFNQNEFCERLRAAESAAALYDAAVTYSAS
jgi:PTS system nitrogen regulatory IIA component